MGRLLELLFKWRSEVLLIFLVLLALGLTVTQSSNQKAIWLSSSGNLMGSIHRFTSNTAAYFTLKKRNNELQEENAQLRGSLYQAQFEKALIPSRIFSSSKTLQ